MKIKTIYSVILFVFIVMSCNKNNSTEPEQDKRNIIPLKLNNEWMYDIYNYRLNEADSTYVFTDSSSMFMSISKMDTLDSFSGYYIKNFIFDMFMPPYMIFNNCEGGLFAATQTCCFVPSPRPKIDRVLIFPTAVGDSSKFIGYTIKTRNISDRITVKAGTFDCIIYDVFMNYNLVAGIWASPDVGIIKSWQYFGVIKSEKILQCFDVK